MIAPLSRDRPGGIVLSLIVIAIALGLAFAPFLFPGARALETAARILIFIVLVASYDLLLGYTGIVSFAHTMFFGMGAYGVAIALAKMGTSFTSILVGALAGCALAAVVAFVIALFSLRVRAIFFAMVTLAVASAFLVLVSQLSWLTGGEDGINYTIPRELTPGFRIVQDRVMGVVINGRLLLYYALFVLTILIFLMLLRLVNSPFGRVLQAIRENAFRAEAIGYPVVRYRTISTVLSAVLAASAGAMLAVWLRYTGPATTLSLEIMIDILLIIVIGGMGTLYGAVIGSVLLILAQNYLQNLMKIMSDATVDIPVLAAALHPDRWLLWLGVLFILSVYFFPSGIVGQLRAKKQLAVEQPPAQNECRQ
ncbi:leucine/isoleucine/valine transporter permease subunit [Variibacter gotjawalensis]|uniref:Leucine/isoleucine/valine transporter permease subunit n=1 Tax=Variibacter gotjawalensis TaxID=1333996 RepID=A0A0S3PUS0_9BRAD|nr:branched-chain amino acid ABC transporter permease [Variibacter gotjawalensis]NIK49954.1 branched-chain amino acid transport system permease protein [Variibacter gotjawalensis]RZS45953.1 amino acid/amide ABC transporter membrane protein 2 (HAAT family) [Variibacter gotjawalensis]BAT59628.1 leucine/isoleucine/valine transporter permease subunit [Variibacter gotjawalensis]